VECRERYLLPVFEHPRGVRNFQPSLAYVLSVTDTTVKVRCKVIAIGQTAALVRGEITSEDGSIIYDVLDHNKINVRLRPRAPGSKL